jgi:hypothetical protein
LNTPETTPPSIPTTSATAPKELPIESLLTVIVENYEDWNAKIYVIIKVFDFAIKYEAEWCGDFEVRSAGFDLYGDRLAGYTA